MATKKPGSSAKNPATVTVYELVGGPFCGVRVSCVMPPELTLLLNGPALHGLIEPALEERYLRRQVMYVQTKIKGTTAVFVFRCGFVEVGNVEI